MSIHLEYKDLKDLFQSTEAKNVRKSLDYFDGKQVEHLATYFDKNVQQWQDRGVNLRFRNIVKRVVLQSGMLWKTAPPVMEVVDDNGNVLIKDTDNFQVVLEDIEYVDFFANLDTTVRLIKTALVLVQYDADQDKAFTELLHQGNAEVRVNPLTRDIEELIYLVATNGESKLYRQYTLEEIIDYEVNKDHSFRIVNQEDNPYGIIPVAVFNDTNHPRAGFWNYPDNTLVNLNELVNVHISEVEWAATWIKRPTLFTNAHFGQEAQNFETAGHSSSDKFNRQDQGSIKHNMLGGPDQILQLEVPVGTDVFVEYKAPVVDLSSLDDIVLNLIKGVASDWSVRIEGEEGSSSQVASGFSLIVRELPNLDLRELRSRQQECGLRNFYQVIKQIINTHKPATFSDISTLFIDFQTPTNPIDKEQQENIWNLKIASGRASTIDYLMEVEGMDRETADLKLIEINEQNKSLPPTPDKVQAITMMFTAGLITKQTAIENLTSVLGEDKTAEAEAVLAENVVEL